MTEIDCLQCTDDMSWNPEVFRGGCECSRTIAVTEVALHAIMASAETLLRAARLFASLVWGGRISEGIGPACSV
jgi:hypothetical protein